MKYCEWFSEWLELYTKVSAKERTYRKYRQLADKYILPKIGNCDLDGLSPVELQRFASELTERGLAASTVNGIVSLLRCTLKKSVMLGITERQFPDVIVRPKMRIGHVSCFTLAEQRKIERYIFEQQKPALFGILLSLYTGLRIGELLALTWEDIDFRKGTVSVTKSCHDSWVQRKYVKVIDSPKTPNSERVIPLPRRMVFYMKELRRETGSAFVVVGRSKDGAQIRSYQRTFEIVLKNLGLEHRGFHALRHTFATRALEVGMDVKTLSEILGHQSPTVTLQRYAHSMLEHKKDMMNKVGKLLP